MYEKKAYDDTNKGVLFREEQKEKETDRDYSGSININGTEFWLSGWIKVGKKTNKKFLSLSVKPKNEAPKKPPAFNDEISF